MKIKEIASLINGEATGDAETEIVGVADYATARQGEIAFLDNKDNPPPTEASCLLVAERVEFPVSQIIVKNPKLAFAKIAALLLKPKVKNYLSETAAIAPSADVKAAYVGAFVSIGENSRVGEEARIHDGAKIGSNVSIGKRTIIRPNCVVGDNVTIGDDCELHAGAVIGADGFGYVRDGASGYVKFPQIGTVVIENNVEIGANSCVDRGALGETRVGAGTKIDNLVQIAHNVIIGKRVVIAAQTGVSGSCVIEDDCVIGGQVGIGDHARILSGAIIGSQAGVLPNKIVRAGTWWGTPVQPLHEYKRQNAMVKGLARLREEVKELKRKISE